MIFSKASKRSKEDGSKIALVNPKPIPTLVLPWKPLIDVISGQPTLHPQKQRSAPPETTPCTLRLNPLHPQTQPITPPDSTHCNPRLSPPQPQTTHCTPGPNPLHPLIQTTASLDSTHSTPRLKPQHPQTQHLCTLVTQPLLQPLNQPAACPDATCHSPVSQPLVSAA